ncbi:MAG: hypothetical protein FWD79_08920 [Desulfobulbus sp.]|nr:hypothetical protein [Desulfobulbus sp.]
MPGDLVPQNHQDRLVRPDDLRPVLDRAAENPLQLFLGQRHHRNIDVGQHLDLVLPDGPTAIDGWVGDGISLFFHQFHPVGKAEPTDRAVNLAGVEIFPGLDRAAGDNIQLDVSRSAQGIFDLLKDILHRRRATADDDLACTGNALILIQ